MARIFRTRTFTRWMNKTAITDLALYQAVHEMSQGLIDADLGGHIFKKRIALPGQGKRGAARTIVATKMADRWFFIYGFNKNERDNISDDESNSLSKIARRLLGFSELEIAKAISAGEIIEVRHENQTA